MPFVFSCLIVVVRGSSQPRAARCRSIDACATVIHTNRVREKFHRWIRIRGRPAGYHILYGSAGSNANL